MLRAKKRSGHSPPPPDASASNPLNGYKDAFLAWSLATGLTAETVRTRRQVMTYFIRWADERGLTRIADFTLPMLERYQRQLFQQRTARGKPLSWCSQHSRLVVLKSFFRWAVRERHLLTNPAADLILPKMPPRLPRHVLSVAQLESVLAQPDTGDPAGLRDRALLEVLYSTGMRRSELTNLKQIDLDLGNAVARVREGKGRRDRVVPVGDRAIAWLEKYLADVRPLLVGGHDPGHLFLTDYGEPFEKSRLAAKVTRYMKHAGLANLGSCHAFRHAAATHMLENGADIRYIQAFLGHSKLDTTQIYTQVSIKKLQEIHAATHPARLARRQGANAAEKGADAVEDV